ncbi:gamma-glutamyl-gamma-aminobutyrate hydrolase family protein [Carboxylicivirga sediminis]|uniref:Gamma-glutamyl-gamma-aminobutyrate hydrolase family protein n=1 Tax=Carboxylicivirga sediminis TaxID=2006564 RepID=A0A941F8Y4_9BACT|nr:gamma-glutamyl-gamma-aminobutyrate hydrolase family protein [Carboxylicivirga sediminis]MBR8537520.1 gamma-glutamyl-gamma-aminobutyrate hydrolase family protein [Carboxylicivirga sediminis]
MLLIIDNQSAFIKKFKRQFLSEQDFDYVFFDHNQPITLSAKTQIKGIILSGGKGNPWEPLNLTSNFVALMNFDVPVLGFCLGHEIIAVSYRGRIKKLAEYHGKKELITITKPEDPIFDGLSKTEVSLVKRHSFHVSELPASFESLATSDTCSNEIIRHKTKPIYGFQSHPEVSGPEGMLMVKNFLKMCEII